MFEKSLRDFPNFASNVIILGLSLIEFEFFILQFILRGRKNREVTPVDFVCLQRKYLILEFLASQNLSACNHP